MDNNEGRGAKVILAAVSAVVAALGLMYFVAEVGVEKQPEMIEVVEADREQMAQAALDADRATNPETVPEEPAMVGVITPKEPILLKGADTLIYTNELLGLSFEFPAEYRLDENIDLDGSFAEGDFFQGDRIAVNLFDEDNFMVFSVQTVSPDFGLEAQEGCCYFFHGELDMTKSAEDLGDDVDKELNQIFAPQKVTIDGKSSLRFAFTTEYVSRALFEGAMTPSGDPERPTVFFQTGLLGELDFEDAVTYPYPETNEARVELFNDILTSIKWL